MIINRLPQILSEQGLSIRELARRTGITYTTIRAVVHSERRSVQLEVLESICLVLAIRPGDIYILATDDGAQVTSAALPNTAENTEGKVDRPDNHAEQAQIRMSQNRRPTRPGHEWRTW